ncbi:MAG: hypothetical protein JHD07_22575 [Bradyrhizobium sp.]|uniref:hypothetical protein n=1 Tax=Bradyrhizobium sp. TaxID=376 RepID=UPI001A349CDD|nr:hypothetical protein [Bradyrhizobium sp.]MBJ7405943.1 hypothetical protein [Bradyrhizobium sp.]
MTNTFDLKTTPSFVASQVWGLRHGFTILHAMLHDLRDEEGEITEESIYRILWTADHVKRELDAAYAYTEGLAEAERARVAAGRSAVVLQAAE